MTDASIYSSFAYSVLACFRMGDVGVGVFAEGKEVKHGVPQLLDIADQDDVTVHSSASQNQLFAVVRPGEIKD